MAISADFLVATDKRLNASFGALLVRESGKAASNDGRKGLQIVVCRHAYRGG
jgi:hypothetical protein